MLGNPSSVKPVLMNISPGPWVLVFEVSEWMKHRSSAHSARCGNRSEMYLPRLPPRLEFPGALGQVAVLALEGDQLLDARASAGRAA